MVAGTGEPDARDDGIAETAWSELLAFLARDGGDRGAAYRELRGRLQFFFEWRGCAGAPELADETLDRVAAKLAAGEVIYTADPWRYAFGVARLVHLEAVRRAARYTPVARDEPAPAPDDDARQRERRLAALDECLATLPARTQQLLLRYHADNGRERIDDRKRLADELGIAMNALRIRVHRVRAQIEDCVRARLERTSSGAPAGTSSSRSAP